MPILQQTAIVFQLCAIGEHFHCRRREIVKFDFYKLLADGIAAFQATEPVLQLRV
jgi:hypothetical protein